MASRRDRLQPEGFGHGDEQGKKLEAWALKSETLARLEATLKIASTLSSIVATEDQFDADRNLLNVENGTVDLGNQVFREHERLDLITKLAPVIYDPTAQCHKFEAFLQRIFAGDAETVRFLQRFFGYSLTGSTVEQQFVVFWGTGANGKSTLVEVIRHCLGEYGLQADFNSFTVRKSEGPRNDLARPKGARFVAASESFGVRDQAADWW
jgi:putative DNA primase/helicase